MKIYLDESIDMTPETLKFLAMKYATYMERWMNPRPDQLADLIRQRIAASTVDLED